LAQGKKDAGDIIRAAGVPVAVPSFAPQARKPISGCR